MINEKLPKRFKKLWGVTYQKFPFCLRYSTDCRRDRKYGAIVSAMALWFFWLELVQSVTCLWMSLFCTVCMAYGFLKCNIRPSRRTSVQSTLLFKKKPITQKTQMLNVSHLMIGWSAKHFSFLFFEKVYFFIFMIITLMEESHDETYR